jgi:uncharacterized damage-inducible protein DinB
MEWADARVWTAALRTEPADPRLHHVLSHVHIVQRAFLTMWTNGDIGAAVERTKELHTLPDLLAWARTYYPEAHAFLDAATDDRLAAPLQMPWAAQIEASLGRPPASTTLAETFLQVTSHSTYHRGQVNARLRELGVEPPLVDYIAWLWAGRPAPEWTA